MRKWRNQNAHVQTGEYKMVQVSEKLVDSFLKVSRLGWLARQVFIR
jgi:hypothetical protein